jgi:hypothetical protein
MAEREPKVESGGGRRSDQDRGLDKGRGRLLAKFKTKDSLGVSGHVHKLGKGEAAELESWAQDVVFTNFSAYDPNADIERRLQKELSRTGVIRGEGGRKHG